MTDSIPVASNPHVSPRENAVQSGSPLVNKTVSCRWPMLNLPIRELPCECDAGLITKCTPEVPSSTRQLTFVDCIIPKQAVLYLARATRFACYFLFALSPEHNFQSLVLLSIIDSIVPGMTSIRETRYPRWSGLTSAVSRWH